MLYERSDASQTRFEGRENISRLVSDVEERLGSINNPLSLRYEVLVEFRSQP